MRSFTRTQTVLSSLAAAAVVVLVVRHFVHSQPEALGVVAPPESPAASASPADSVPATTAPVPAPVSVATSAGSACAVPVGTTLGYRLRATTRVQMNNGQPPPPDSNAGVTLDLKALTADASGTVLLARLHDADASIAHTRGNLTAPFLLRLDGQCHLAAFARLSTTPLADARSEQGVAYGLQFTWPKDAADAKSGTLASTLASGENAFGAYRASFTRASASVVEGRIEAYTHLWDDDALHPDADTPVSLEPTGSHLRVDFGGAAAGHWFATLTSTEQLAILGTSVENELTVKAQPPGAQAFDGVPTDAGTYVWEDLLPRHVQKRLAKAETPAEKAAVAEAAKLSLPQALHLFENGVQARGSMIDVAKPLASYFEAHPESAKIVAQQIKTGEIAQDHDAAVFVALGLTPNTEARDALLSMKNDASRPAFDRARSAFALVDRSDVGVDLAKQLRSDSQAITSGASREDRLYARHAALAVGMMAGRRGTELPDVVAEAKGTVSDILSSQPRTNVLALKPAFEAAANIGDSGMLGTFTPYLLDRDPSMRREAFIVMRRMPPSATTSMAVALLRAESDWGVKARAYHVLWLQHHDAQVTPDRTLVVQAVADLLTNPATLTRQALIQLLGPAAATVPEARSGLLAWAPREYAMRKEGLYDLLATYLPAPDLAAAVAAGATK
jgi:hypothetical protein